MRFKGKGSLSLSTRKARERDSHTNYHWNVWSCFCSQQLQYMGKKTNHGLNANKTSRCKNSDRAGSVKRNRRTKFGLGSFFGLEERFWHEMSSVYFPLQILLDHLLSSSNLGFFCARFLDLQSPASLWFEWNICFYLQKLVRFCVDTLKSEF